MKLTDEELTSLLSAAGLRIKQPFNPKQSYRKDEYIFTQCLDCGTEAHYRLKYILEKGGSTCRACYWSRWYADSKKLFDESVLNLIKKGISRRELIEQGIIKQPEDVTWNDASKLANEHGYDLIDLLRCGAPEDNVMVVKCQACGRQTAERPCDVRFGCTCTKSKMKNGGIPFGSEATKVDIAADKRDVAPRTPGARSIEQHLARHESGDIAYSFGEVEGKVCADFPELVTAWNDIKDPSKVSATSPYGIHFRCPEGHHPNQTPYSFLVDGCMVCRGLRTKNEPNKEYLDTTNPELAAEWDLAIDGDKYTPHNVGSGSKRKVRWKCIACGETWVATVRDRELRMNNRCPHCGKVMGSLAWKHPEIARMWSPNNPISPWNTKPTGSLDFKPEWVCPRNPNHVWTETAQSVIKKNGKCPYCG